MLFVLTTKSETFNIHMTKHNCIVYILQ